METKLVQENFADVYTYPDPRKLSKLNDQQSREVTLPDLHGNAMKLLFTLIKEGIADLPEDFLDSDGTYHDLSNKEKSELYKKLVLIYTTPVEQLTADDIHTFDKIIDGLQIVDSNVLLRFIGDEFGDRGSNDYFTLKILERLQKYEDSIQFESVMSNHTTDFALSYYNAIGFRKYKESESDSNSEYSESSESSESSEYSEDVNERDITPKAKPYATRLAKKDQGQSLTSLQTLIDNGLIEQENVIDMTAKYFLSNLKLLSYSLSADKKELTIYSHAPIGLNHIKQVAEDVGVSYNDENAEELAATIDAINTKYSFYLRKGEKLDYYEKHGATNPFTQLTWNRNYENLDRPAQFKFVHGHDSGEKSTKQILNIDDALGKSYFSTGTYTIVETAGDISLKKTQSESEEKFRHKTSLSQKFLEKNKVSQKEQVFLDLLTTVGKYLAECQKRKKKAFFASDRSIWNDKINKSYEVLKILHTEPDINSKIAALKKISDQAISRTMWKLKIGENNKPKLSIYLNNAITNYEQLVAKERDECSPKVAKKQHFKLKTIPNYSNDASKKLSRRHSNKNRP